MSCSPVMEWCEHTGKKKRIFWMYRFDLLHVFSFVMSFLAGKTAECDSTAHDTCALKCYACNNSKCCFGTSRGQHELKVKWGRRKAQCHPGPWPCQYTAKARLCIMAMSVVVPCVFNFSDFDSGFWCGHAVVWLESFLLLGAVVLVSAVAVFCQILGDAHSRRFCLRTVTLSLFSIPISTFLQHIYIYKQFTCPSETHLLPFKHQLSTLHSFSTCRHSRLRASLNVQVVMTTTSAALNTTLRVWRSS